MVPRVEISLPAIRSWIGRAVSVVLLVAVLAGCGSTLKAGRGGSALATINPAASSGTQATCPATVLKALDNVVSRVYHEGVFSERTASAEYLITHSAALREAVETDDAGAAGAAAAALLATGHMTNLRVLRGNQTLVNVGGAALTPLHGTLVGKNGAPIASYIWSRREASRRAWPPCGWMGVTLAARNCCRRVRLRTKARSRTITSATSTARSRPRSIRPVLRASICCFR